MFIQLYAHITMVKEDEAVHSRGTQVGGRRGGCDNYILTKILKEHCMESLKTKI